MPRVKKQDQEEVIALSVRLPVQLKLTIERMATEHRRSLNQECVWLLEQAVAALEAAELQAGKRSSQQG